MSVNNNRPVFKCVETHEIPFSRPIAKGMLRSDIIYVPQIYISSNAYIVIYNQSYSHLATAISKRGLSYGRNPLVSIQCHWIHIQWKVFDGGSPSVKMKCLYIKLRSNAWISWVFQQYQGYACLTLQNNKGRFMGSPKYLN